MATQREPIERVLEAVIAVPVSFAVAARQLLPIPPTRAEQSIARNLGAIAVRVRRGARP